MNPDGAGKSDTQPTKPIWIELEWASASDVEIRVA